MILMNVKHHRQNPSDSNNYFLFVVVVSNYPRLAGFFKDSLNKFVGRWYQILEEFCIIIIS
jgi:hypothetical protein